MPEFLPDTPEVRSDLLDYYLQIEWYDAQLGQALRVLEQTGELENTLIVVTSDNGMPFPHAKVNLYDWGVPMPLALRWGAKLQRGRVVARPAGMAGKSLLPLLLGQRKAVFSGMERNTMCRPEPRRRIEIYTRLRRRRCCWTRRRRRGFRSRWRGAWRSGRERSCTKWGRIRGR